MAKRYSDQYGIKAPKKSASRRTWRKWRVRKNIATPEDEKRKRENDAKKQERKNDKLGGGLADHFGIARMLGFRSDRVG